MCVYLEYECLLVQTEGESFAEQRHPISRTNRDKTKKVRHSIMRERQLALPGEILTRTSLQLECSLFEGAVIRK